jgi:hypothetical protein
MPCKNPCCPPHNFFADRDPLPSDCQDSVVPGYETDGGYCTGSYWRNTVTGQIFIGIDDMGCNTATWLATNSLLVNLAHVRLSLGAYQSIPTATITALNFLTLDYDVNGDWEAGNHEFIAPRDGYYLVRVTLRPATSPGTTTTGWAFGENFHTFAYVNGVFNSDWISGGFTFQHATGASQVFNRIIDDGNAVVKLSAGDILSVLVNHDAAGAQTFHPTQSILTIDELSSYGMLP